MHPVEAAVKEMASLRFPGALNYTSVEEYKLGKMLGQGAFAMVREAYHVDTGYKVAVKIYDKYKLNKNVATKKSVQRKIRMLSLITKSQTEDGEENIQGHPSVMKLYDAIDT